MRTPVKVIMNLGTVHRLDGHVLGTWSVRLRLSRPKSCSAGVTCFLLPNVSHRLIYIYIKPWLIN